MVRVRLEILDKVLEHKKTIVVKFRVVGEKGAVSRWEESEVFGAEVVAFLVFARGFDIPSTAIEELMLHERSILRPEDIKGSRLVVRQESWWFDLGWSGCRGSGGETVEFSHKNAYGLVVLTLLLLMLS